MGQPSGEQRESLGRREKEDGESITRRFVLSTLNSAERVKRKGIHQDRLNGESPPTPRFPLDARIFQFLRILSSHEPQDCEETNQGVAGNQPALGLRYQGGIGKQRPEGLGDHLQGSRRHAVPRSAVPFVRKVHCNANPSFLTARTAIRSKFPSSDY